MSGKKLAFAKTENKREQHEWRPNISVGDDCVTVFQSRYR